MFYDFEDFKLLDCSRAGELKFIKPTSTSVHSSTLRRGGSAYVDVGEDYYPSLSYFYGNGAKYRPKFGLVKGDTFERAKVSEQ